MDYTLIKNAVKNAKDIREESYVTITDEHGTTEMYSKSVYDASLEVAGADTDLFNIVYLLLLNSETKALEWARQ